MVAWKDMDARDKVVVWLALIIGIFLLCSVTGVFVLEYQGKETGEVWSRVFDLVGVLAGGLLGYVTGTTLERSRK
jgi:hypothetical protein